MAANTAFVDVGGTFTDRIFTIHSTARQAPTAHGAPISAAIDAGKAAAFTSRHLEEGAPERRLSAGVGDGSGYWHLELDARCDTAYDDDIARRCHFPNAYLGEARKSVGDWIVYREPRRGGVVRPTSASRFATRARECGTGAQTLVLAQSSPARIFAVNNHPPFIDALNREARRLPAVRRRPERAGGGSILVVGLVGDCLAITHQSVEGLGIIEK